MILKKFRLCITLFTFLLPLSAITPNAMETQVANLIVNDSDQQRAEMVYDPTLHLIARKKAEDMANRAYVAHVDPDGYGPNKVVTLAGYTLPSYYPTGNSDNHIEAIIVGTLYPTATSAVEGWRSSASHEPQIFGKIINGNNPFYTNQTRYAVGYANVPGSQYTNYYVFLSAHPEPSGDEPLDAYFEWQFTYFPTPAQVDVIVDEADPDGNGISNIFEFALGYTPGQNVSLPTPAFNKITKQLQWTLPVVADLGSVLFEVQYSADLSANSFSANNVTKSGNIYSAPTGSKAFLRLFAERQ